MWAEGNEHNREKIERGGGSGDEGECVGEQIGQKIRGVRSGLSWCLHRPLSHRLSPVSHAWPP